MDVKVAELHERLEAERAILLVAQQEAGLGMSDSSKAFGAVVA